MNDDGLPPGGFDGGLPPDEFDALQYIASNPDLIVAFGASEAAAEEHYQQSGQAEGRDIDSFDEWQYLANYPDLEAAYGATEDTHGATRHYVEHGYLRPHR